MIVIDTCSLVNFVRYYLPFDNESKLFDLIKNKIEAKEIIVIDKVYEECKYVSQGIVVEKLPYLKENKTDSSQCLPNKSFFNQVSNNFINASQKNKLPPEQFEVIKNNFLESADAKQILYCLKNNSLLLKPRIVTEETEANNDSKNFKKLPSLCKLMDIECITLPTLMQELKAINLKFGE